MTQTVSSDLKKLAVKLNHILKGDTAASIFGEWQKLYKNSKHRSNENKTEPAKQSKYFSAEQFWERSNATSQSIQVF
jgi:hypothetical protein